MSKTVFVLCFFIAVLNCEMGSNAQNCGMNGSVSVHQSDCEEGYNASNIMQDLGIIELSGCSNILTADFSNVPPELWLENFNSCSSDTGLSLNIVIYAQKTPNLQRASCFKQTHVHQNTCLCRMDCLLQFNPNTYILYFKDIGCSGSEFSTSLQKYKNSSNVEPMFDWKSDNPNCTEPGITSSLPSPSLSTVLIGGTSTVSMTHVQPSITETPSVCDHYDINLFDRNETYCHCNHDLNTPFGTFLKRECNSSASSNQYFIRLSGGVPFSRQSLANCSQPQYPLIGDLFNSVACSSGQWRIMNVSCECGSQTDYTPSCSALTSSAPSISNCVFQFSGSDSNVEDAVVFITGLTHSERNDLLAYFRPCVSNEMVDCSISSTPPSTSPSISMTNQGKAAKSGIHDFKVQLALGVGGGTLLIAISLFVFFCVLVVVKRKRSSDSYNSHGKHSSTGTSQNGDQLTTSFVYNGNLNSQVVQISQTQYTKWKRIFSRQVLAADQIVIMETIGEGAFGLVQKGELRGKNGRCVQVAIKAMKDASTPDQVEEFISESAIMLDFDHPNVLGLLGVCFDTNNGLPLIVLPFMSNGDLKSYLQVKRRGTPRGSIPEGLSIILLMRMCLDIAKGMAYLARRKFVHRDLAARNCMVDENLICRVADFGLSRDVYSKDYYRLERRVKLPVKWMPPECLHDNIFNEKSDVWSFGVTCWELFSLGRTPYPGIDNADIVEKIDQGYRLKKPSLCPKEVYLLLSQCWDESAEMRPCFTILVDSLKLVISNWESHDHTLRRQMESELQSSLEQDGFESDSQELDCTGSMATRVGSLGGSRGVGRKNNIRSQRISSGSSLGTSTINSRTALLGNSSTLVSLTQSSGGSPVVPHQFSLEDANFTCNNRKNCRNSNNSLNEDADLHSSVEGSERSYEEMAPDVPMFEMFYDHKSPSSLKSNPALISARPNEMELSTRSVSQSSCRTEETNIPDTPMEQGVFVPSEYSLPVTTKPPHHQTQPNEKHKKEGGLSLSSRASSRSSHPQSSRNSHRTGCTSHTESPASPFYFTLEPSAVNTASAFDSDTASSSQTSCDLPKSGNIYTSTNCSDLESPILAYQPQNFHQETLSSQGKFCPSVSSTETTEDDSMNGFAPHRHLVLSGSGLHGQKFDSELSP